MRSRNLKKILTAVGAVGVVILIFVIIAFMGNFSDSKTDKIGFIMSGSMDEAGWNGMHYSGVKKACEKLGAELIVKENVKEFTGECNEAIKELAQEDVGMIILSSYGYSKEAQEVVKQYPDIVFYVNSSEHHDVNMTSYFARMYQARYLAGVVAGLKTKTQKIGYVAAMPNNEVNRGINAFALGVKRVNPEARVMVKWTNEWDNAEKEKSAAFSLIAAQADVLSYHQNQPNVIKAADEAGVYSIAYHEVPENVSSKCLTSVVCNWALVYEEILREFTIGKGNIEENYWIGMEKETVSLSEYSAEVTDDIKMEVEKIKNEILNGRDVFSGIIYDNEGNIRCGEKEVISDEILLEDFGWFVEGVEIYEK